MLITLGTAFLRLFFFFHSCFAYRSFTMVSFLFASSMLFALFLFPFCLHSFMHSFLCRFYTRTLVLLYMFYNIFSFLRPFDLFLFFFRMIFRFCHRFFIFLQALKVFLRIYASPDTRTRSDRFVDFFPFCFANDRLIPYRSDVSLLSFICHGCFIPIPPCFFLIDALVFFRLCRLSVAFVSAFSSCFGKEASVRFSSVVRLVFALFPLRFICFGLSLSVYLFSNKKKRISALFVCLALFFSLLLITL